ncbi:hypothetical protein [Aquisediminimonas profunda]|uniref:hypothetical protein n=1 Tax=Aquisediminimonas profunda TaxID=1550733 RepID=UPI001C632716|nr:hypothetical protein [Aquisediminimonas profunda]
MHSGNIGSGALALKSRSGTMNGAGASFAAVGQAQSDSFRFALDPAVGAGWHSTQSSDQVKQRQISSHYNFKGWTRNGG